MEPPLGVVRASPFYLYYSTCLLTGSLLHSLHVNILASYTYGNSTRAIRI